MIEIICVVADFIKECGLVPYVSDDDIMVYKDGKFIAMICVRDDALFFSLAIYDKRYCNEQVLLDYSSISKESIGGILNHYVGLMEEVYNKDGV